MSKTKSVVRKSVITAPVPSADVQGEVEGLLRALKAARSLIVEHHGCHVVQEPGAYCPVCHPGDKEHATWALIEAALARCLSQPAPGRETAGAVALLREHPRQGEACPHRGWIGVEAFECIECGELLPRVVHTTPTATPPPTAGSRGTK